MFSFKVLDEADMLAAKFRIRLSGSIGLGVAFGVKVSFVFMGSEKFHTAVDGEIYRNFELVEGEEVCEPEIEQDYDLLEDATLEACEEAVSE